MLALSSQVTESSYSMNILGENKRLHVAMVIAFLPVIPITLFDLRVSQLVADKSHVVGGFVSEYGELPGFVLIYFALLLVIVGSSSVTERIGCVVLLLLLVLILFTGLLRYVNAIVSGTLLVLMTVLFTFIVSKLKANDTLCQVSRIIALLAFIAPLFIVQTMKWLWGRTRFRDLRGYP